MIRITDSAQTLGFAFECRNSKFVILDPNTIKTQVVEILSKGNNWVPQTGDKFQLLDL